MTLGRQMDNSVDGMLPHDRFHLFAVADVTLHETVIGALLDIAQILEVAGVGQLVEIDNPVIGIFPDEQPHHMAADESGSAGNQNMFHNSSLSSRTGYPIRRRQARSAACQSGTGTPARSIRAVSSTDQAGRRAGVG